MSSGKGQSVIRTEDDNALGTMRSAVPGETWPSSLNPSSTSITKSPDPPQDGPTLFCPPIGHRQERGDYQESWQPMPMEPHLLEEAQRMAESVTASLRGAGIWGVEFFIQNPTIESEGTVYFSELSPRPHDTGMVTLAGTQNFTEFELHARAVLGIPVSSIDHVRNGASAVVLAPEGVQADASPVVRVAADAPYRHGLPGLAVPACGLPPHGRGMAHGPIRMRTVWWPKPRLQASFR